MVSISIVNTALVSTSYNYLAQVSRRYCSAAPVYSLRARYCSDKVNRSGVCNGVSEEPRRGRVFIIKRQTGRIIELETKVHTKVRNHKEGPFKDLILVESGQLTPR